MPARTSGKRRGTATKHAKRLVLQPNRQTRRFIEGAKADKVNDSPEHLRHKLHGFLRHIVRQGVSGAIWARLGIGDMINEKILDWLRNPRENASYSDSDLKLHKKLVGARKGCPCGCANRVALFRIHPSIHLNPIEPSIHPSIPCGWPQRIWLIRCDV